MPPAVYFALVFLIIPTVILAEPLHVPLSRRRLEGLLDFEVAANNLRYKYGYALTSRRSNRRADAVGMPILVQGSDTSYSGVFEFGEPPQNFNLVLDTGSSDLWVVGPNCAECPGLRIPTFNTSKSTTFEVPSSGPSEVSIKYGSGDVSGTLASDTVTMGGFTIKNQIFLNVDQLSSNVIDGQVSGLIGLAFQSIASTGALPFWQAVLNNNQFPDQIMSFWLARNKNQINSVADQEALSEGGVFTFGGTNSSLYSGDIEYIPLQASREPSYWLLPLTNFTVNGTTMPLSTINASCAIDTGTTLIGGPAADVRALYSAIPGSRKSNSTNTQGFFFFPCSTKVEVSMSFGGQLWPIAPQDFDLGPQSANTDLCLGAVFILSEGSSIGSGGGPDWIIGDTFLKSVYSVFRANPPSVGFAQLSSTAGGSGTASAGSPSSTSTSGAMSTTIPAFMMLWTAFIATIILCL